MGNCLTCGTKFTKRHQKKYCSNQCQSDYQYGVYIKDWKIGKADGSRGIAAKNISAHLKRYLTGKFGERCSKCGWEKRHPKGYVPLEIDHIDGDSENNIESNLRLLCPNCHALTPNFKNHNKGNGRKWRIEKYLKNT